MSRGFAALTLVAFCPLLAARGSEPGDADSLAAQVSAAQADYDLGHFREALQRFEALYRQRAAPALLFNIGQCHRKLGELREAAETYRSFLRKVDDGSADAARAKELLAEVEAAMERERAARAAPPSGTVPVQGDGWRARPEPVPVAARPQAVVPSGPRSHTAAYVLGSAGIASAIGGGVLGLLSHSAGNQLVSSPHDLPEVQSLADKHRRDAIAADALFAAAVALGLIGWIAW